VGRPAPEEEEAGAVSPRAALLEASRAAASRAAGCLQEASAPGPTSARQARRAAKRAAVLAAVLPDSPHRDPRGVRWG
jgi:hypothetical protein